jgi:hypothetical protein
MYLLAFNYSSSQKHNSVDEKEAQTMDATVIPVTAFSQATTVSVDYVEDRTWGVALPKFLQDSVPTYVVLFSGKDKFIFPPESLGSNVSRRNWTPPRSKREWSKPKHKVCVIAHCSFMLRHHFYAVKYFSIS